MSISEYLELLLLLILLPLLLLLSLLLIILTTQSSNRVSRRDLLHSRQIKKAIGLLLWKDIWWNCNYHITNETTWDSSKIVARLKYILLIVDIIRNMLQDPIWEKIQTFWMFICRKIRLSKTYKHNRGHESHFHCLQSSVGWTEAFFNDCSSISV